MVEEREQHTRKKNRRKKEDCVRQWYLSMSITLSLIIFCRNRGEKPNVATCQVHLEFMNIQLNLIYKTFFFITLVLFTERKKKCLTLTLMLSC